MKNLKRLSIVILLLVVIPFITGCDKKVELKFDGEEGSATFQTKESYGCKVSTNKDDFRTSRDQGVLLCKDFKISIEFDDISYFYPKGFDELKEARKENDEFKEVTYSGIKGIQYFYASYNSYEVILPIKDNKKYVLNLSVYGLKDTEESAKEAIKSEAVDYVLNNVTFDAK